MRREHKRIRPGIYQILRIIKSVLLVFALVIGTNLLGQRHLSIVRNTVGTAYEDRIVSQYHLYRLYQLFNLKRLRLSTNHSFLNDFQENKAIEQELADFADKKHTSKELLHFNDLKKRYSDLSALEKSFLPDNTEAFEQARLEMNTCLDHIMINLDSMANAKHAERAQLSTTKSKSLNVSRLLLNVEIAFLIVVGIIIQLVIYFPWRPLERGL